MKKSPLAACFGCGVSFTRMLPMHILFLHTAFMRTLFTKTTFAKTSFARVLFVRPSLVHRATHDAAFASNPLRRELDLRSD